jgi:integrase
VAVAHFCQDIYANSAPKKMPKPRAPKLLPTDKAGTPGIEWKGGPPALRLLRSRQYQQLEEGTIAAFWEARRWQDDIKPLLFWDMQIPGLRLRMGKLRFTWDYTREHSINGKRSKTCVRLGHWPEMLLADARKAAQVQAGKIAAGRPTPGKKEALKFHAGWNDYLAHLQRKADRKDKVPYAYKQAKFIGDKYLLPQWGGWSLHDLSFAPGVAADWHRQITNEHGPIMANRAAALLRAAYRRAARIDRGLPPQLPTSAVEPNPERARQVHIEWKAWRTAWLKLEPIRQAYHLFMLTTGCRGSEALRLTWTDLDCRRRVITFRNSKSGADTVIPMSTAIARALIMARDNPAPNVGPQGLEGAVFRGCIMAVNDRLPVKGHGLRHVYRTVAADIGVDELTASLLLGHSLRSVSQKYLTAAALLGLSLRQSQARISREILKRSGIATSAPLPPHPNP